MKVLIVEDDFSSRKLLQKYLTAYGEVDIAVEGGEAIKAFVLAWKEKKPYNLICMDIMMPNINGQEALQRIRDMEKEMGVNNLEEVKVIMITALSDPKNVVKAFYDGGATSYIVKPIRKQKLINEVHKFGFATGK